MGVFWQSILRFPQGHCANRSLIHRGYTILGQCLLEARVTATLIQSPDRVILHNISWQSYQSLVRDCAQQPALRLTYDQGTLEIRMRLDLHETYKKLIGRLIEAATEELDV